MNSDKKYLKAADGSLVPAENIYEMRKLYKMIVATIESSGIKNITIVIDALVNALLLYTFKALPRIELNKLKIALENLYKHWQENSNLNIFN
jgi:hypothetical protein